MNILFISTWFPYPLNNGSRIRVHHLLKALSREHQVQLVAFLPPGVDRQGINNVQQMCTNLDWVERDPFWRDPGKRLSAHFSIVPRDVIRGYSAEMARLVSQKTKERHYDVIIASTIDAAQYAAQVNHPRRLLEEHNFTTIWMKERYRNQIGTLQRAAGWITWQKCRHYEQQLYPKFVAVTMVSKDDLHALKENIPQYRGRLEVIPNGVDLETRSLGLAVPLPDTLVFNGSLTYAANLEAIRWFVKDVLPLIRQQHPETRLVITGDISGLDLSWLVEDSLIHLTGYQEDICTLVAQSWLAVAPLRSGGGTRLKILEAMALGVPVIATNKGAQGLHVTSEENILIADDPVEYAHHCVRILDSTELREKLVRNARLMVEAGYDWKVIGEKYCQLVEQVASETEAF